ncbi:MAG: methyltransferase regulatory domain-containing protein, partial [Tepidiformaceae bacterium]
MAPPTNDELDVISDVYDEVHYPGLSHFRSHPGHMGAIAQVLGLDPAGPERCRVLEIGCASGYNLIPMAETLPGSEFIGIDTSQSQVAEGRAVIKALGLTNIELQHRDLSEIGEADGKFDYIISYGVYSWVPEAVRDRLIAVIRANLAESGIAYLSYDTYPGWFQMQKMREMMLYHTRRIEEPLERVAAARKFVAFLAAAEDERDGSDGSFIEAYARSMIGREDGYLLHDELAPINDPVYFHEFAEHLERHGLAYLAESDFPEVMAARLKPEAAAGLQRMARTLVEREQYMDFLRDRGFRESLVSHVATVGQRDLTIDAERYRRFYVGSHATPVGTIDAASNEVARFEVSKAIFLATNHPVSKAAMLVLDEAFPLPLSFD